MKNLFRIALAFMACMLTFTSCTNSKSKKVQTSENSAIREEAKVEPVHYFVVGDKNILYDAPDGKALMYDNSEGMREPRRNIGRDDKVIILEESGEWVKVQAVECHPKRSQVCQGWVKKDILSEKDYINYDVLLEEGNDYEIFSDDYMPRINLRNYHIKINQKGLKEPQLLDIASTLRKKYQDKTHNKCQIWLYDAVVNMRFLNDYSYEPSNKEWVFWADHQLYFLSSEARIGDYYPMQGDYSEYKSHGGKNWKKNYK